LIGAEPGVYPMDFDFDTALGLTPGPVD